MTLRHCCVLIPLIFVVGVRTVEAQCTTTVSPTSVSVSSIGSTSAVSVTTGTNCFWMATSSVSWITVTSGATGAGIGQVTYTVAANSTTAVRVGTLTVGGQTVTITQATGSCSSTVTPTSVSVPSIASAYTLSVVSGTSCAWTAVSNVSWITVTAGASGSAIGSVSFNVAATTTARTGTLTVAGQTVTVTQAAASCVYTVTPTSVSVPSIASAYTLSVVSGTSCAWTAVSNVSWITVTAGASGSAIGSVSFNVAATTTARTGTLTVAGQTVTVTQAGESCVYTVTPTTVSVPSIASAYTLSVVSGTSCAWTAVSNVSWITVTAGASGSAIGSVSFNVAATTTARTGTLTVAGQTVTVTQAGESCVYAVTPTSVSVPSIASAYTLSVVSGTSCAWTAVSNVSWITVTSGASGSAIGSVSFNVAATTTARTGTLTVAGQTVTVTQAGASCSFTVTPTTVSVPSIASAYTLSVVSGTSCAWTAVSNVSWITVTAGASGSAIGSVSFNVAATTTARTGTLTVAGQTVTVTQAGESCVYTVTPTTVSVPSIASAYTLSVVSGTSCAWTAVSNVSWITVTSGASGSAIGSVSFNVAATTTARTGTLTVAGQTVTVTQAGASCSFTVTPTSVSVPSIGSTSALSVSTGTSCSWTAVSNVSWITVTSGAAGAGIGQVNYTVAANSTTAVRVGTLTVAGQTVTFTQAAVSCAYTVTPTTVSAPSTGNTFTLAVSSGTSCAWTAMSNANWITVTAGASGSGIGTVTFTVAATTTSRTGTLTVAGRTVTVTEDAPTPPLPPTNLRIVRGTE